MTLIESTAFLKDIHKVLQKHGLTLMHSNNPSKLVEDTKHLEGFHLFFTKGNNKLYLRGGEDINRSSCLTIKMTKARFNSNTEDDGN